MHAPASAIRTVARRSIIAALVLAVAGVASVAAQGTFPTKVVRIIIGPSPDAVARVMAQYLQAKWGHAVVVETRAGAGGQIAATAVATAEPDGHTLLFATPSYTLNTAMKTASYDVLRDFAPAALIGTGAYTLVVHPSLKVNSVAELVAYIKAHPGQVNCASAGIGTAPHLACETFNTIAGVKVVHVPYRGVNEAMNGVVAGHVQMFVAVSLVAKQQMQAGTVRGLATTGPKRSALLPELPTLAESGYPNFVLSGWNGFLATAGTPKFALDKIGHDVPAAYGDPEVKARMLALGQEFLALDADGFAAFVREDIGRWKKLVDAVGIEKLRPQ
ncbi:MAG: hypothetical protein IT538_02095 [Variibacter sp.]|nr:hypothetical protein [Variibacter sp.]